MYQRIRPGSNGTPASTHLIDRITEGSQQKWTAEYLAVSGFKPHQRSTNALCANAVDTENRAGEETITPVMAMNGSALVCRRYVSGRPYGLPRWC